MLSNDSVCVAWLRSSVRRRARLDGVESGLAGHLGSPCLHVHASQKQKQMAFLEACMRQGRHLTAYAFWGKARGGILFPISSEPCLHASTADE